MTGAPIHCTATTLSTTKDFPSSSPLTSSLLRAHSAWPNLTSMDNYARKVMLVPDPLAAAAAEAAASSSSSTAMTTSDRMISSEGYSSASSLDNPALCTAVRALMPGVTMNATATASFAAGVSTSNADNNSVPEFLYQLTKMLTDDNRDIIEWSNGKIEVHSPHKLESQVLHKYFRHSKFASFQRQLNYFGFRKLAGKGKMAPCSYVNDDTTQELRSLLMIKRKASLAQTGKEKTTRKRDRRDSFVNGGSRGATASTSVVTSTTVNPVLAGILQRSTSITTGTLATVVAPTINNLLEPVKTGEAKGSLIHDPLAASQLATPQALAQAAVGKGIKHGLRPSFVAVAAPTMPAKAISSTSTNVSSTTVSSSSSSKGELLFLPETQMATCIQESLSQLTNNFRNSLNDMRAAEQIMVDSGDAAAGVAESDDVPRSISPSCGEYFPGMLSRNSSLVDLAMIPEIQANDDDGPEYGENPPGDFMSFVDFPNQEMIPLRPEEVENGEKQQPHDASAQGERGPC